jgi:hypothetical protein
MIRRMDGRIATAKDRERRQYKVSVWNLPKGPHAVTPRKPRVPRTEIVICVACRRSYKLGTHDPATCARKRGLDGNDLYVREHALVSLCASGCGAIVSSPGAVCIGCIGGHA